MQGILKTQGLTVAGSLEHGRVKVVPHFDSLYVMQMHQYTGAANYLAPM